MQDFSRDKVCLVTPPSVFLLDERVFMTLGILKVAAVLERAGVPVEHVDLSGIRNYSDAIEDHVRISSAHVYGITATTPQLPAAAEIALVIKRTNPQARLILGGPHATLVHAAYRRERKLGINGRATHAFGQLEDLFDVIVAGDGEEAIFYALSDDAPRVIDADDPRTPLFLDNARLTTLPFPARHLVDVSSYHYHIDDVRTLSLIAQLGCPFECWFCGGRQSPSLRRVRTRTSESIVSEIEHLHDSYDVNGFMFYDDELNVNTGMIDLMGLIHDAQRRKDVEWRLRGFIKAQLFNDAQAAAMYRAGFRWILVGFESGSPRILQNINKRSTREENTRCIEIARRHGLRVKALMSIGHPGESEETVRDTRDWLLEAAPDDFDVSIITTYPGTPYYDFAVRSSQDPTTWVYTYERTGDRLYSSEVDYIKDPNYYKGVPGQYRAYVHTDFLTSSELVQSRDETEQAVRKELGIPFQLSQAALAYEHSMGQGGLPAHILRSSKM